MKKKYLFSIILISITASVLIYISCKRNSLKQQVSIEGDHSQIQNRREDGIRTYYSRDNSDTTIVYSLTIKKNEDGSVEIHRQLDTTNYQGSFNITTLDNDVDYTVLNEETIKFNPSKNIITYIVPFNPIDSIQGMVEGGRDSFEASCECKLVISNPVTCEVSIHGITVECKVKNCQKCQLKFTRKNRKHATVRVYDYTGGFIMFTANSLLEN